MYFLASSKTMTITTLFSSSGCVVRFSCYKQSFGYSGAPDKLQSINVANRSRQTTIYRCLGECSFLKEVNIRGQLTGSDFLNYKSQRISHRPTSSLPAPSLDRPCFVVWLKMALAANAGDCILFHKNYSASGNKTLIN